MRILGIDPGTLRTGYGVVSVEGTKLRHVASGTLTAPQRLPLAERLALVHRGLVEVIETHQPVAVAIEEVYVGKHVSAALALGHARGVAMLAAAQRELPVHEYAASVVKKTVVGKGSAEKEQVARLVGAMLGLLELPGLDATDALALAITHSAASRMNAMLVPAVLAARSPARQGAPKSKARGGSTDRR